MGYLRLYDYTTGNIQGVILTQLLQGNDTQRVIKEAASQAQIISYLVQKFDTDAEFKDTTIFSPTATYQANALTELNYAAWVGTVATYPVNSMVSYTDGNCYICIQDTTVAHEVPTNTSYWRLIGKQNDLNYIPYPYPLFENTTYYNVGDKVFWKGKVYECQIATPYPNHVSQLNDITYQNIPLQNVFPDNGMNGKTYWGTGVSYSVTGLIPNGVLPSAYNPSTSYTAGQTTLDGGVIWQALTNNTGKVPGDDIINWQPISWVNGDNRNAQIVECMVWITIDKLAPLISPRNIPVFWQKKYDEYLAWLQMCAQGDVTLGVSEKQPSQGARIRFGGLVKQQNGYVIIFAIFASWEKLAMYITTLIT